MPRASYPQSPQIGLVLSLEVGHHLGTEADGLALRCASEWLELAACPPCPGKSNCRWYGLMLGWLPHRLWLGWPHPSAGAGAASEVGWPQITSGAGATVFTWGSVAPPKPGVGAPVLTPPKPAFWEGCSRGWPTVLATPPKPPACCGAGWSKGFVQLGFPNMMFFFFAAYHYFDSKWLPTKASGVPAMKVRKNYGLW